jgi:acyl-CoA thioesterase FadM
MMKYQNATNKITVCYGKITNLTLRSKFKVKGYQQCYTTHRLEVVYLHAKYEKPILNDKKVTARTRFVTDPGTDLTLRLKLKVKEHQQWYATHRLEMVYLHVKYEKPVLNDKKSYSLDTICYGRTNRFDL